MTNDSRHLIDKPKGWTSFDVVAKIRGRLRAQGLKKPKVGHAGTLDPLATGLLIVLVGSECKNQDKYMKLEKTYQTEMKLGQFSTTEDAEGEITDYSDRIPTSQDIDKVLAGFRGDILQTPPIYSAIKVDGKRAYKLAREGKSVKMKSRQVTIHSIDNVSYEYPVIRFDATVSSGTYIRSLVRDIGEKLGTGAYMTNLRRTQIGDHNIRNAKTPDEFVSQFLS